MCSLSEIWQRVQQFERTLQKKLRGPPSGSSDSDDSFAALSEITAPEVVDREDEPDHIFLEQTRPGTGSDIFTRLSEVSAPEPVQKQQNNENPRRPSLEQSISTLQRKRHSR